MAAQAGSLRVFGRELRDASAVPDLIAATERDHTTAEEARRALVQITKHDFGLKARKWRGWWEKHKERPRIEWMLDGLAAKAHFRRVSIEPRLHGLKDGFLLPT